MTAYPEILKTCGGETVRTQEEWEKFRRPEILTLFTDFVYGRQPFRGQIPVCFSQTGEEKTPEGWRRRTLKARAGALEFPFYLILPGQTAHREKVPVLFYNMFGWDMEKEMPVKTVLERGYALCCYPVNGVASDCQEAFQTGIFQVAGREDQCSWGAISAWAWGASGIMDYLQTVPEIHGDRVAVAGHSRGGKTALWEFATDRRFALCLSLNSGCGGAATSREKKADGESVAAITANLGYWFADMFQNYAGKENMLPVDQHMLLALAAPRPLYVVGATQDAWADPDGELRSCRMAGEAYALYGKKGLVMEEELQPDKSYGEGTIAYHRRTGGHATTPFDWKCFFDFADRYLKD